MQLRYTTQGTCASEIIIEVEGTLIKHVEFVGGCTGNSQGIARLVVGRTVSDVIRLLKGIPCQGETSCPDQLAKALMELEEKAC